MYCRECGYKVAPYDTTCPNCYCHPLDGHKYCQECGKETNETDNFCTACSSPLKKSSQINQSNNNQSRYTNPNQEVRTVYITKPVVDEPNDLANIASFCCFNPWLGLILYLVWMNEKPKSAQSVCYWTIGGFIFSVIVGFIFAFLGA